MAQAGTFVQVGHLCPTFFIVGHEWPTYGAVEEGDSRVSPSLGAVYHSAVNTPKPMRLRGDDFVSYIN